MCVRVCVCGEGGGGDCRGRALTSQYVVISLQFLRKIRQIIGCSPGIGTPVWIRRNVMDCYFPFDTKEYLELEYFKLYGLHNTIVTLFLNTIWGGSSLV